MILSMRLGHTIYTSGCHWMLILNLLQLHYLSILIITLFLLQQIGKVYKLQFIENISRGQLEMSVKFSMDYYCKKYPFAKIYIRNTSSGLGNLI